MTGHVNLTRKSIALMLSSLLIACTTNTTDDTSEAPQIVEVFACSDYCPGPEEQYIKRVYDGVVDEEECRKLGGEPYTYVGWGQRTVCEVR